MEGRRKKEERKRKREKGREKNEERKRKNEEWEGSYRSFCNAIARLFGGSVSLWED